MFKGSNLTKEAKLCKKETKRDFTNAPSAERLHTRNYISYRTAGRNNMNAPSVSKHLLNVSLLQFINKYTQEKSPISAVHVGRPLVKYLLLRHTRISILGKSLTRVLHVESISGLAPPSPDIRLHIQESHTSAVYVGRPFVNSLLSRHTSVSILGKSPINAVHVGRPLVKCFISRHIRGSILGKSHTSAVHVGWPLINCLTSRNTRRSILGKSRISVLHVERSLINC